jgi:hypothetical protein
MFDLDKAVGAWRRAYEQNRVLDGAGIPEAVLGEAAAPAHDSE